MPWPLCHPHYLLFAIVLTYVNTAHERAHHALINCHTRSGESGSSRGSTPSGASAAATAFAITPPTGMTPPSPAPFAPRGLLGEGLSSSATALIFGKSLAVGIM